MQQKITLEKQEFFLLRDFIEKECGISVGEEKMYLIENRLAQLVEESACNTFSEFYFKAKSDPQNGLREKIIDAMTTNETLWFRDGSPYEALRKYILPEWQNRLDQGRMMPFRIWSAACSTGQEPYSIVMTILEYAEGIGKRSLWERSFTVLGTDISKSALLLAQMGRYNDIAMSRGMVKEIQDKYFKQVGRVHAISDEIKKNVQFSHFNLQNSFSTLGTFDLIFIRNVAIYFSLDFKKDLFQRISRIMAPDAYLFLGSSESMMGISSDFEMIEFDRAMAYRLRK